MIGGNPTLWNVQLQPSKPGGEPTITTDGGPLHITSATGVVYIDGVLVANLSNSTTFGSTTTATNVFTAGIFVSGSVSSTFSTTVLFTNFVKTTSTVTISSGGNALFVSGVSYFFNDVHIGSGTTLYADTAQIGVLTVSSTLTANSVSAASNIYAGGYIQAATKVYAGIGGYTYDCLISGGNSTAFIAADGSGSAGLDVRSLGSGAIRLQSNSGSYTQFNVAAVSSAVNYYTTYGHVTGGGPTLTADGSDTNINALISSKGTGAVAFFTGQGAREQFYVADSTGTNQAFVYGGTTPTFGSNGGDLQLLPSSTYLQIGQTFSAAAVPGNFSATSYWTIKDAAGNTKYVPVASATW